MRQLFLFALALSLSGCPAVLKHVPGTVVLDAFNTSARTPVTFPGCRALLASRARDTLAEIYDQPNALAPLDEAALPQEALADAVLCLRQASRAAAPVPTERACLTCLLEGQGCTGGARALSFPPAPALASTDATAWVAERDVQRLQHGLTLLARSQAQACNVAEAGPPPSPAAARPALVADFANALRDVRDYQAHRAQRRTADHPISTWVLSGGAANGAYSAGATWWLLRSREACGAACERDRVDMLAGASTGTVIASVLKQYFDSVAPVNPANQTARALALDTLEDRYLCSTNDDLYCIQDTNLYGLLLDDKAVSRGLVDFRGLRTLVADYVNSAARLAKAPEQFASAVDFDSGDVLQLSSADIRGQGQLPQWHQALEASLVEPILAEPVECIGPRRGTWLDGGVRSGLPLAAPLRRGAERAVVFINGPLNGIPQPRQPNLTAIVVRGIGLFAQQPVLSELAFAEQERVLKREGEKDRCLARLGFDAVSPAVAEELERRCSRATAAPLPVPLTTPAVVPRSMLRTASLAGSGTLGTPSSERIEDGYRSAWLFMPELLPAGFGALSYPRADGAAADWSDLAAAGYTFSPREMWNLFLVGALTAAQRCSEVSQTLGWHLGADCADPAKVSAALAALKQKLEARAPRCIDRKVEAKPCEGKRPAPVCQ